MLLIVDIDNTIADSRMRLRKAGPYPVGEGFEAHEAWLDRLEKRGTLVLDPILGPMFQLIRSTDLSITYLTNRRERHREETEEWLLKHRIVGGDLILRPEECGSSPEQFKETIIKNLMFSSGRISEEILVIDDNEGMIGVCADNGWFLLQPHLPEENEDGITDTI